MSNKVARFLLEHNRKQSEIFNSPDAVSARNQYMRRHPTKIAVLKCMDGRLNLAVITKTEPGILSPFRNIGGKFKIGWPHFGSVFQNWLDYSIEEEGADCLVLATYHYSEGDTHRGCAGHGYKTDDAVAWALRLRAEIERMCGERHATVYPIVVGIETDRDKLVLHGHGDEKLDLSTLLEADEEAVWHKVRNLYPDMESQMHTDLMELVRGNISHVRDVVEADRPIEAAEHKEDTICVGRGFDTLHLYNKALIVGPYSPNLAGPIATAGKVVLGNIKAGRIDPAEGIVLMSAAPYHRTGFEQRRAVMKAEELARIAYEALSAEVPELIPHLHVLVGAVDDRTRLFEPVEFDVTRSA